MLAEKESVRPSPAAPPTDWLTRPPIPASPASAAPQLRVHLPDESEAEAENSRVFPLRPDHWERLRIDLPDGWTGQSVRLEPGGFGLLEIAGVRVVSRVMGEPVWELLGRDLVAGIRATPATQLVSSTRRLRLLCTDGDTQLFLPEVPLPVTGEPLTLELGLRVRTDVAQVTHVLHSWVAEADAHRLESTEEAVDLREDRDRQLAIAREYLTALEMARTDGSQREAALREQLATAHGTAREHAATLTAEIDEARADGNRREAALKEQLGTTHQAAQEYAATLLTEVENARAHGDQRAAVLGREIENTRAHGEERVADMARQLGEIREHLEQSQAQLHDTEVEVRELQDAQARWLRDQALFQQEISGLHQELQRTEQLLNSHRQQFDAELAVERGANATNQGRVQSMQRSFSWRVTLPFRILARILTGRKTAAK